MKIAIDISQIVFEGTGTGNYTRNLVKNLLKINNQTKAHSYVLFGTSLRKKNLLDAFALELRREGLIFKESFWMLPPTFTSTIWNQVHHMKIERLIGRIDIFHTSDWTEPPTKAKKVTTIHDLVVHKFPEVSHPEIVANQLRKLELVKKESNAIIAVSKTTKTDIEEILKIPSEKITVIYEGVGEIFKSQNVEKTGGKKYILGMGGVGNRKNTEKVTEAFEKLKRKDLELKIIGKNLGFVPEKDLPALYHNAEMFVFPSLYEGFGLPVLEAMSAGTPVITSNSGSLPEVGGMVALYVDPNSQDDILSKMEEVLSWSSKKRAEVIKSGKAQAAKFTWEKCAQQTLEVYESL